MGDHDSHLWVWGPLLDTALARRAEAAGRRRGSHTYLGHRSWEPVGARQPVPDASSAVPPGRAPSARRRRQPAGRRQGTPRSPARGGRGRGSELAGDGGGARGLGEPRGWRPSRGARPPPHPCARGPSHPPARAGCEARREAGLC